MASDKTHLLSKTPTLPRGQFCPASSSDIRGPCPMVNSLANHGLIPRDGRNVHPDEVYAAAREVGISTLLATLLAGPVFLEFQDPKYPQPTRSFFAKLWFLICNPWAILFARFGMRRPGQQDSRGKCLDLDQLGRPGVVEHDVSLSRRDYAQGDNVTKQEDLIERMLAASSDGEYLTMEDMAGYRKRRIAEQMRDNPALKYGTPQHKVGCGEIGLVLLVLGDGQKARCDYMRALFMEERLPSKEGWKPKTWWRVGLFAMVVAARKINRMIGLTF